MKHSYTSLFIGLMCAFSAQAAIHQVTSDKSGTELQAAIATAESGDTVLVQAGTYYGNFQMKEGVNVIGGWNSTFDAQTDYATILDAQANGRVVNQAAAFGTLTIWENFTIQNGNDNNASTGGGGVWLNRLGQLKHCEIRNNITTGYGGGVAHNVTAASTHGEVVLTDCWIHHNTSGKQGGGVRIGAKIENSLIERNTSGADGAGVYLQHGCIYNCVVRLNHSTGNAGGIRAYGHTEIWNNLIYANLANGQLGGLSQGGANRTSNVVNNTIVCNRQISMTNPHRCGAMCGDNATKAVFANNIVWKNYVGEGDSIHITQVDLNASRMGTDGVITNNAYFGNKVGTAAIALTKTDPGFVDIANADTTLWDLHLVFSASNLLNQGSNTYVTDVDLEGKTRIAGGTVDLGCYELPYFTLTVAEYEHATLLIGEDTIAAKAYELPKGYTDSLVISTEEGYQIARVTCGDAILVEEEGVYVLPSLLADMTLAIETEPIMFDLTVAAFEHATLILDGDTTLAGTYPLAQGHIATAVIVADEKYQIKSVTCGDAILEEVEGVYTLPAMLADMTLAIEVEETSTGIDNVQRDNVQCTKLIRNGQLFILRDGKEYNVLGQKQY